MRPRDRVRGLDLAERLRVFGQEQHPLPGLQSKAICDVFLEQIVESIRRIEYIAAIEKRHISDFRAQPSSDLFDPIRAAILHKRKGGVNEAFWLVFLAVHFGRHRRTGWRLVRDVYGGLGNIAPWDWSSTSRAPDEFDRWLTSHHAILRGSDGVSRGFGNHRKYESVDRIGDAIKSYVKWVGFEASHERLISEAQEQSGGDPRKAFDCLYHSMSEVVSFGRMAKFDYLTMIGKLDLALIEPGSTYLQGATGPLAGARLLLGGSGNVALSWQDLDLRLVQLGNALNVGMQVVEDALCNWQKSPAQFKSFRG